MKSIINGKTYNTETAELIVEEYGHNVTIDLYRKECGEFFFHVCGGGFPPQRIQLCDEPEAKTFLELGNHAEEYIKLFGEPSE